MSSQNMRFSSGFTIVELLVVVVVIGILASVTTVAFNGIQKRSKTSVIYANAKQIAKSMTIYAQHSGNFPNQFNSCFGEVADFPATGQNNSGQCWTIRDSTTLWSQASVNTPTSISTAMSSVVNTRAFKYDLIQFTDTDGYTHALRGFWYSVSGSAPYTKAKVSFAIPGDTCPGDSVEFIDGYYINCNICQINVSI